MSQFLQFLGVLGVAIISTYGLYQGKKLERQNTHQHGVAQQERSESELKLLGKLDSIHEDVQDTAHRVGGIDQKLNAHINDRRLHDKAVAEKVEIARDELIEHGDQQWSTKPNEAA